MAQRREDLRAADVDRQFVAEWLKAALDEGRLSLAEYDERLGEVYAAKTYGDLDKLLSDLPGFTPPQHAQLAPTTPVYPTAAAAAEPRPHIMPRWLLRIWSAWLAVVSVCLVIWVLTSVSSDDGPLYFWPMWVAGPWGAALLVTTITAYLSGDPEGELRRRAERKRARDRRRGRRRDDG